MTPKFLCTLVGARQRESRLLLHLYFTTTASTSLYFIILTSSTTVTTIATINTSTTNNTVKAATVVTAAIVLLFVCRMGCTANKTVFFPVVPVVPVTPAAPRLHVAPPYQHPLRMRLTQAMPRRPARPHPSLLMSPWRPSLQQHPFWR